MANTDGDVNAYVTKNGSDAVLIAKHALAKGEEVCAQHTRRKWAAQVICCKHAAVYVGRLPMHALLIALVS